MRAERKTTIAASPLDHGAGMHYITRDWSSIKPGTVWVADHHALDMKCRAWDESAKKWRHVQPCLFVLLDIGSSRFAAWSIGVGAHLGPNFHRALIDAIRVNGSRPPSAIMHDLGKDFLHNGILLPFITPDGTEHSIIKELGCKTLNPTPYGHGSKRIERFFREIGTSFAKHYQEALAFCKPKKPETLPTVAVLSHAFDIWNMADRVNPFMHCDDPSAWGGLPAMTHEELTMATLLPLEIPIVECGCAITLFKQRYVSKKLWPLTGQRILVKATPALEQVWAFSFDGKPICKLRPESQTYQEPCANHSQIERRADA